MAQQVVRRRSGGYVRSMNSQQLHGLGGKLLRDFRTCGLTARQDRLLSSVLSELEYRARRAGGLEACLCELCMLPFPE